MTYISKRSAHLLFIAIVMASAGFMLYSVIQSTAKQMQLSEQKLVQEARAHFDNMVVTRSWNAMYGGVYVKQAKGLEPNQYLKGNFILDSDGNRLIRINPAWMTRQISELSNNRSNYYYKITSLKPINPHNAPDAFEAVALHYFDAHPEQHYYYRLSEDRKSFDFMGSLITEEECLACHQNQGYKVGDIRGGIRVSIPTSLLQQELEGLNQEKHRSIIFIVLSAALMLFIFYRFLSMVYEHQKNIEELNKSLEKKVTQRTQSLEKMYQHEKYINELLKIVSSVNELLLASISVHNVLRDSSEQLVKHKHYCFAWVGMVNEGRLEVAYQSENHREILSHETYSLSETDPESQAALQAILQKRTLIEPFALQLQDGSEAEDEECTQLHWRVAIPLTSNESERPFGVFNIYSDRVEGFDEEEVRVLERLAVDIGLILHSHKQKAVLEKMEHERVSNYEETILAFVNIIEQRDTYTAGHTLRVAEYCKKIATALGIEEAEIKRLERAAILHDIGKVATPDSVLLKPGKLTALEYDLIKQHAYAGFNMLSKIDMYKDLAEIIRYHHAWYNGKGYPQTKSPEDVPFLAHIMVVADAFDAMTTTRIYRPKRTVEDALAEIEERSGSQFHPKVVEVAVKVLKDIQIVHTTQAPSNELEQKRFSYFFEDSLTGLYNENYLQMLIYNPDCKYDSLYLILLSNFSQYNKHYGWDEGSNLLAQLARDIKKQFPDALAFRYHGDDFALLFEHKTSADLSYFDKLPLLIDNNINVAVKKIEVNMLSHSEADLASMSSAKDKA